MSVNKFRKEIPSGSDIKASKSDSRLSRSASIVSHSSVAKGHPVKPKVPHVLIGTIEELIAYLGIIKARHAFFPSRITMIQECLTRINNGLTSGKKEYFLDGDKHSKELDEEIQKLSKYEIEKGFPGTSPLEAELVYARSICKRAERQISGGELKNEETYLNKTGEYLGLLASYSLLSYQEPK